MVWVIGILMGLAVFLAGRWLWLTYNDLVRQRNEMQTAWHHIETETQRRLDLIPNLVNTVRGYASHEHATLEAVTRARAAAVGATTPQQLFATQDALTEELGRLMFLTEAYPVLRADSGFLDLQAQLAQTEDRIAFARRYFNETARSYNTAQQQFPATLVASAFGHTPTRQFTAKVEADEPPMVSFQ